MSQLRVFVFSSQILLFITHCVVDIRPIGCSKTEEADPSSSNDQVSPANKKLSTAESHFKTMYLVPETSAAAVADSGAFFRPTFGGETAGGSLSLPFDIDPEEDELLNGPAAMAAPRTFAAPTLNANFGGRPPPPQMMMMMMVALADSRSLRPVFVADRPFLRRLLRRRKSATLVPVFFEPRDRRF